MQFSQRRTLGPRCSRPRSRNRAGDSLRRASRWLRSMQLPNGAWHDFWTPSGTSDEWVTAYVGAALALSPDAESRASAGAAWRYLIEERRSRGGWGYCRQAPSDADSTAWALILADRIGEQTSPAARDALGFILSSCVLGGIATYADVGDIREYVEASPAYKLFRMGPIARVRNRDGMPGLIAAISSDLRYARICASGRLVAKLLVVRGCLRDGNGGDCALRGHALRRT